MFGKKRPYFVEWHDENGRPVVRYNYPPMRRALRHNRRPVELAIVLLAAVTVISKLLGWW